MNYTPLSGTVRSDFVGVVSHALIPLIRRKKYFGSLVPRGIRYHKAFRVAILVIVQSPVKLLQKMPHFDPGLRLAIHACSVDFDSKKTLLFYNNSTGDCNGFDYTPNKMKSHQLDYW